jgi:hypothetical protein
MSDRKHRPIGQTLRGIWSSIRWLVVYALLDILLSLIPRDEEGSVLIQALAYWAEEVR